MSQIICTNVQFDEAQKKQESMQAEGSLIIVKGSYNGQLNSLCFIDNGFKNAK